MDTGKLLCSNTSGSTGDVNSLKHGSLDLYDVSRLVSCARGGRKIIMTTEFQFGSDVVPILQLFFNGERLGPKGEEEKLRQPNKDDTIVFKGLIVFLSPPQEFAEEFFVKNYQIKILVERLSDSAISNMKFNFEYLPHDFHDPCIF